MNRTKQQTIMPDCWIMRRSNRVTHVVEEAGSISEKSVVTLQLEPIML